MGRDMTPLPRATPTLVNVGYGSVFMWDGRAKSLEEQALGPITSDVEMSLDLPTLARKLEAIAGYRTLFAAAYPGEGISGTTVGKALASFERTIVSTDSPFDRWMSGQEDAVGPEVKRGLRVFEGKGLCANCHQGFNFTDDGFHNIGVEERGKTPDLGRFTQSPRPELRGAFKTPTLRDIALTAPFMHNGIYRTLEEVVEHYDRGGDTKENLSQDIKTLGLTAQEKSDLVAFMKSLTGKPVSVVFPRLPN
jgi:cytochrome c peroxidase